jgi:hypothetical protein
MLRNSAQFSYLYHFSFIKKDMTKFGETADRILEIVSEEEKLQINEIEKKIPLKVAATLDFMKECGLVEIKNEEIGITSFGQALLNVD